MSNLKEAQQNRLASVNCQSHCDDVWELAVVPLLVVKLGRLIHIVMSKVCQNAGVLPGVLHILTCKSYHTGVPFFDI